MYLDVAGVGTSIVANSLFQRAYFNKMLQVEVKVGYLPFTTSSLQGYSGIANLDKTPKIYFYCNWRASKASETLHQGCTNSS